MKKLIRSLLLVSALLAVGATFAAAAPTQVSLWSAISGIGKEGQTTLLASTTPIGKMDAALLGIDWNISWTQNSDWDTAFNLRLASNDWPEAISGIGGVFRQDHLARLVDAGVIVPLDKYYHNTKYPNINLMPQSVIDYWKHVDGHIYNFPSGVYQDQNQPWGYWAAAVWTVRPDYLQAVGMTAADLGTLAGVEKFLRAVKAKGLKNADGLPVYPISSGENVSFREVIMNTFGVDTAAMGFQMINGKLVNWRDNPQTKAAFKWLNSLWIDGIIDPEALSQKNDTLREKMMGKRVALMADWAWPFWQTVTAGTAVTEMVLLPYPTVPGVSKPGINVTYNPNGSSTGLMLTKNAKNPDLIASFANQVWSDFDPKMDANAKWEHQLTIEYGTRGTMWDWDPKVGKPYYVTKGDMLAAAGDYNKLSATGFQTNPLFVQGNDSNYFTSSLTDVLDWIFKMHKFYYNKPNVAAARPYDNIKVPADGLWNKNRDILGKVDLEYWAKLVSADKGTFDTVWTAYQNQLEQQGSWSKVKAEVLATYK